MKYSVQVFSILLLCSEAFTSSKNGGFSRTSFGMKSPTSLNMAVTKDDLVGARDAIDKILDEKNCGPIFVRLAWHDSGEWVLIGYPNKCEGALLLVGFLFFFLVVPTNVFG